MASKPSGCFPDFGDTNTEIRLATNCDRITRRLYTSRKLIPLPFVYSKPGGSHADEVASIFYGMAQSGTRRAKAASAGTRSRRRSRRETAAPRPDALRRQ